MASTVFLWVLLVLALGGWAIELAGVSGLQAILDKAAQASISQNVLAYTSTAYEYIWWVIWLQFASLFISAGALAFPFKAPVSRLGATALLAVVVTSSFLLVNTVWNNPYTYSITHSVNSGGSIVRPTTNYGKTGRSVLALLSGSIIFSISSVLLLLWLPDTPPPAEKVASVEAAAAEAPHVGSLDIDSV